MIIKAFEKAFKRMVHRHRYKCACANLAQFYFWFEYDWIHLREFNFALYEIGVESAIVGKEQVLFLEDDILSKREVYPIEYRSLLSKLKANTKEIML